MWHRAEAETNTGKFRACTVAYVAGLLHHAGVCLLFAGVLGINSLNQHTLLAASQQELHLFSVCCIDVIRFDMEMRKSASSEGEGGEDTGVQLFYASD